MHATSSLPTLGTDPALTGAMLTRKKAAAWLGVHVGTLDRWSREGFHGVQPVPRRVGGRLYYGELQLKAFVAEAERRRNLDARTLLGMRPGL